MIFAAILTAAAPARPTMRDVLVATYRLHDFTAVQLSPDGVDVTWTERFRDPRNLLHSALYGAVYVQRIGAGERRRITAGNLNGHYSEEGAVWSPDGHQIAFLSDARSSKQLQIFVADPEGGHLRQVGSVNGDVQRLTWSPSGKELAVLYITNAHRQAGALAPGARDVGVIGATVEEQRLATVGVADGNLRFLTPADTYIYEYGWSPDGRQVAVTYAKGNGDNNWWIARLARVDAQTGAMHDLLAPAYQIDDPQWSPDGSRIAVIGGIMSDFGSTGGDVYVVDAQTGESRDVTDGAPVSVQSLRWNDSSSLDVVAHVSGSMRLMRLDTTNIGTDSLTSLTNGEESLSSWSSARGGAVVALARASFAEPPALWAGAPDSLRQLTSSNAGATRLYGKAVSLKWKSDDFTIQGWLVYPLNYDPQRDLPDGYDRSRWTLRGVGTVLRQP